MVEIGTTEKLVLSAVCNAKQNTQTAHLIAMKFQYAEDTVNYAVGGLISKKLIFETHPRQHGKRFIRLTDKGECFAIIYCSDVHFDTVILNHPYIELTRMIKGLNKAIKTAELRTVVMRFCAQELVKRDLFSSEGDNLIAKQANKFVQKALIVEWTNYVKNEIKPLNDSDVDLGKWEKFMKDMIQLSKPKQGGISMKSLLSIK